MISKRWVLILSPERGGIPQPRATPWVRRSSEIPALRGRHNWWIELCLGRSDVISIEHGSVNFGEHVPRYCAPSGLENSYGNTFPGRCPGLMNFAPLGLETFTNYHRAWLLTSHRQIHQIKHRLEQVGVVRERGDEADAAGGFQSDAAGSEAGGGDE